MPRWGTIALAAGTFVAGFATSELVDGPVPVEPSPVERPAPRPVESDLEWTFGEAGLTIHGEPGQSPRFFTPAPDEAPPVEAAPSGKGIVVPRPDLADAWVFELQPVLFCTSTDCKPCLGDPAACGAPPPPTRMAESEGSFHEIRFCRTCDEENCIKPVECNTLTRVEPTADP